jgi:metalloendopeptidase OMA1, mitochondrial
MQQYGNNILPDDHPLAQMCQRVVSRLVPVTGMEEGIDWKVHVINRDDPNAFVIPGGKIFVFTVFHFFISAD